MPTRALRTAAAWLVLAPVTLVGAMGAGLHDLVGCAHQPATTSAVCSCGLRHAATSEAPPRAIGWSAARSGPSDGLCCGGCAVCDLLGLFHSAASSAPPAVASADAAERTGFALLSVWPGTDQRIASPRGPPVG